MYYRARFYSPEIGRFVSSDPHPGLLSRPSTLLSKHVYVSNNPLKFTDPKGEFFDPFTLAIVGAVIGGINGAIKNAEDGGNWFEDVIINATIGAITGFTLGKGYLVYGKKIGHGISLFSTFQASLLEGNFFDNLSKKIVENTVLTWPGLKLVNFFKGLGAFFKVVTPYAAVAVKLGVFGVELCTPDKAKGWVDDLLCD